MASRKSRKRTFNGMSYGQIQSYNSNNRKKLKRDDQKWLKDNGYKNVGWDQVVRLYQKIEEILDKGRFEEMSLEELFLEADRIGNKYLEPKELEEFNQQFAEEVHGIEELIEQQFPDTEAEMIDFSNVAGKKTQRKPNQATYRTTKR